MEFVVEPITVIGYHGTSLEAAERILQEGFQPSVKSWEWLGHGIYFWQDAPYRAYEWGQDWLAKTQGYRGPIGVVAAEIELQNVIDLIDQAGMKLLRKLAQDFVVKPEALALNNTESLNRLDCALFNYATKVLSSGGFEVAGYRAACIEGLPLTIGSPIYDLSHVQLVMCNPQAVRRTWMVEEI